MKTKWRIIAIMTISAFAGVGGSVMAEEPSADSLTLDVGCQKSKAVLTDWPEMETRNGKSCRTVPRGKRLNLVFNKPWPANEFPADAYALCVTYLDDFRGTQRLFSFINREGDMGWNELLAIEGTGEKQWKSETTVVDGGLLDHDTATTVTLGFQSDAGDWSVAGVELHPASLVEIKESRRKMFARIREAVWKTAQGLTALPSLSKKQGLPPTKEEKERGYLLFTRDFMEDVLLEDLPRENERRIVLRTFAAQGEIRPLTFTLRTFKPLTVRLKLADMKSENGVVFPASAIEAGYVQYAPLLNKENNKQYQMTPMHICPLDRLPLVRYGDYAATPKDNGSLELSGDCAHRFWLTLRVPPTQPAGVYRGKLALEIDGKGTSEIELTAQTLPFSLPTKGIRHMGCYSPTRLQVDALRDQVEHGCTMQAIWHNGADMPVKLVEGKPRCDTRAMDVYMKRMQWLGMTGPLVYFAGNESTWMFDEEVLASLKDSSFKITHYKEKNYADQFSDPKYDDQYGECLRALYAHAKEAEWNRLVWCPFDEPAMGGQKAVQWMRDADAAKKFLGKEAPIFCVVMNRGLEGRKGREQRDKGALFFDSATDIFSVNGQIETVVKLAHQGRKEVWAYSKTNRFTGGFLMLKTGANAAFIWAYNWLTQRFSDYRWADSESVEKQWSLVSGHMTWFVSYPDVDGHLIPTPDWERWREGCNDNRYICLLEQQLERKRDSDLGKKIVEKLEDLKIRIQANERSKDGAGIENFVLSTPDASLMEQWRRQIAGWITQLGAE